VSSIYPARPSLLYTQGAKNPKKADPDLLAEGKRRNAVVYNPRIAFWKRMPKASTKNTENSHRFLLFGFLEQY